MIVDGSGFLSREELLGGLPARRASTLLFAIEGHTAYLVGHARQAMARLLPERTAEERERALINYCKSPEFSTEGLRALQSSLPQPRAPERAATAGTSYA